MQVVVPIMEDELDFYFEMCESEKEINFILDSLNINRIVKVNLKDSNYKFILKYTDEDEVDGIFRNMNSLIYKIKELGIINGTIIPSRSRFISGERFEDEVELFKISNKKSKILDISLDKFGNHFNIKLEKTENEIDYFIKGFGDEGFYRMMFVRNHSYSKNEILNVMIDRICYTLNI